MTMHSIKIPGNGAPLLLLHGWGQSHKSLMPLAEVLSSQVQPTLVDLPGFGNSKAPDDVWNASDYSDRLVRHLDSLNIEKCSVLGHSFGGKVAIGMALRYPERIDKLILIASSGLKPKRSFFKNIQLRMVKIGGKLIKTWDQVFGRSYFKDHFVRKFGSSDYKKAGEMRSILVKTVNEDLSSVLPNLKCPTLILWGEKDLETPIESGIRMSRLIRNSQFYSFPHHDHEIIQDVGAHLLATYIIPFLNGANE